MESLINLESYCVEIGLSYRSAIFFIQEGKVSAMEHGGIFFINDESASVLKIISEIETELGVNDEGASVILDLRKKILNYQNVIKIFMDALKESKSIDELMFALKRSDILGKLGYDEDV